MKLSIRNVQVSLVGKNMIPEMYLDIKKTVAKIFIIDNVRFRSFRSTAKLLKIIIFFFIFRVKAFYSRWKLKCKLRKKFKF